MKRIVKILKTKSDIVSEIAKKKGLAFSTADLFVDAVFEEIIEALLNDRKVELRGFGVFGVKKYKAYKGRNPQNQKRIMVRAKKRPWFKPGIFHESLNKK